ncbi:MAG: hypothetical protein H6Q63_1214 [Firmicutes bacterium]|nr:hypothetical protein [Bacillota bacterium]
MWYFLKKAYIVALILIAIFFVSITGCSSVGDKIAEKTAEGIAEQTLGGKVDITKDGVKVDKDGVSFETGQDLKWPKGTMGDLPEPKAKISAVLSQC